MKILCADGRFFYVKNIEQDYHCEFGFIKRSDLKKKDGSIVKTNTDKELVIFSAFFSDMVRKMKRAPQIIPLKDVGLIITETGVGKESIVLDAGTGSGSLAIMLSNIVKKVVTYELRDDFRKVAQHNFKEMGLTNIVSKKGDIYTNLNEKNMDLVTLDVPEPWKAIETAKKSLKIGGYLVSYSPTIVQVQDFIAELKKHQFIIIKTCEVSERMWEVEERKVRPKSQSIGHSGFLCFARKIGAK